MMCLMMVITKNYKRNVYVGLKDNFFKSNDTLMMGQGCDASQFTLFYGKTIKFKNYTLSKLGCFE